ncbi:molybdopterin molybdotransferase MoeA [Frigoriglobus tundricola]|uniref:Molybdopterin molybdenumtransferase n=1 Tax=Frigoriglobus tundricola TaxID=2774151 RepID=A0A6M5YJZ6_9BACT|nr:gephyrin-like molybdotransferase Glp [Frigoriglobus tundricola]QJW94295.1 Molybdopterin molybdenumtransferase [Frigoriglobus tundricola]
MSDTRFDDVRMRGFLRRADVDTVLTLLDARTSALPGEPVPLSEAAGRVLALVVTSNVDVPAFARAAMDGYAVCAADTADATPTAPRALTLVGESLPARPFSGEVKAGQAVRITTGAPVPLGADAVLMAELAELEAADRVAARAPVVSGKHIVRVAEDVARGSVVLPSGRRLRPQDVGLLASIGTATVTAVRRPRVAILVTGHEVLPPGAVPEGHKIVDSNSPMLAALAARDGASVLPVRYVRDDPAAVREALVTAAQQAEVILCSGGTSVGTEDHAPRAAAELGELAVHGVALRPAGPLGIAFLPAPGARRDASEPPTLPVVLFLLPGNPVSCLCAYDLFAGRVVRRLGGRSWELPYRTRALPLARDVPSTVGRVDYVRVKVEGNEVVPLGTGGASNLSTAVAADGFVLVPAALGHLTQGENVTVWLYDA